MRKRKQQTRPRVKICDEGAANLRAAILKQAVLDYKLALDRSMNGKPDPYITEGSMGREALEKWFLSGYGQMISGGQGREIIRICRKELGYIPRRDGTVMLNVKAEVLCPDGKAGRAMISLKSHIERHNGTRVFEIREAGGK